MTFRYNENRQRIHSPAGFFRKEKALLRSCRSREHARWFLYLLVCSTVTVYHKTTRYARAKADDFCRILTAFVFYCKSAACVAGPHTPSTLSPLSSWSAQTAPSVMRPKSPSISLLRR